MNSLAKKKPYYVQFINYYEEFDTPLEVNFKADDAGSIDTIISALSAFYSGDPCECYINGEQALLDKDWGLLK